MRTRCRIKNIKKLILTLTHTFSKKIIEGAVVDFWGTFLEYFHFIFFHISLIYANAKYNSFNSDSSPSIHRWQQRIMGIAVFRRSWLTKHDLPETSVEIIKTGGLSLSFCFCYFLFYFEVHSCVTFWFSFPSFVCFSHPFCSSPVISYSYPPMYLSLWLNPYFYPLDLGTKALVILT